MRGCAGLVRVLTLYRLPCRWHGPHIIVLDEVVIVRVRSEYDEANAVQSGPAYDKSSTYVPSLRQDQLERLLRGEQLDASEAPVERAHAKAQIWQRVTKVVRILRCDCTRLHGSSSRASAAKLPHSGFRDITATSEMGHVRARGTWRGLVDAPLRSCRFTFACDGVGSVQGIPCRAQGGASALLAGWHHECWCAVRTAWRGVG